MSCNDQRASCFRQWRHLNVSCWNHPGHLILPKHKTKTVLTCKKGQIWLTFLRQIETTKNSVKNQRFELQRPSLTHNASSVEMLRIVLHVNVYPASFNGNRSVERDIDWWLVSQVSVRWVAMMLQMKAGNTSPVLCCSKPFQLHVPWGSNGSKQRRLWEFHKNKTLGNLLSC